MANKEHESLIHNRTEWNKWRNQNPKRELDLSGADLRNENLSGINLNNANLSKARLTQSILTNAKLIKANLDDAELKWANLQNASLTSATLNGAYLEEADLREARLDNAILSFSNLTSTNLNKANLTNANLASTTLNNCNLQSAKLINANLTRAMLRSAEMTSAKLTEANLEKADLSNAKLNNVNMRNATVADANFTDASFHGADLRGTNFKKANITNVNFTRAIADEHQFASSQLSDEQRKQLGFPTAASDRNKPPKKPPVLVTTETPDEHVDEKSFREAFIKFLREKKGYPSDSIEFLPEDAPDLAIYDIETRMILAFIDFKDLKEQGVLGMAVQNLRFSMQSVFAGYIVCPGFDKLYKPFDIFEVTDTDEPESISHNAFPDYEELKQKVAGKKLTLSDFEVRLGVGGIKIFEKIIELAGDSNIGLHSDIVDESYVNLTLSGLVDYRNNVVVQIHRYGGAKTVIALAVVGPKKGTVWEKPELNDFITKGDITKLSGYKKGIPGERAWLNGNLPKKGAREEATVYVIYPDTKGAHWEVLDAVERLLKWAVENYSREDEKWKIDPVEPEREMSADEFYVADGKTKKDLLGFMPYVKAVAAFLTHARTQPPLTMSVEGEWGSGKSSFMLQLQDEIERIYAKQGKGKCFVVEFDPWRHDKDEELWAAFVREFIRQTSKKLGFCTRVFRNCALKLKRFDWGEGWVDCVKFIGLLIVWLVVTGVLVILVCKGVQLDKGGNIELPGWIGSVVVIAGALFIAVGKVKDCFGSPFDVDLRKYMGKCDYVSKINFIEKFHEDFKEIVQSYVGENRVYVFVDDLDRCKIPKAAELLGSINLMLSDNPKLVFILGMDREKVAAGLAVKHEKLLPYLSGWVVNGEVTDKDYDKIKRKKGIRYGYSFIEKFIQVPFVLPIPRQDRIKEMLLELAGQGFSSKSESKLRKRSKWSRISGLFSMSKTIVDKKKHPITKVEKEEQIVEEKVGAAVKKVFGDDENFRHIVQMVSPYLKYNPRRVKQFVNLFRLRYVTAMSTNLFEQEDGKRLTFEQLGKFVGVGLGWPLFIKDLERNYKLLDELVDFAEGKKMPKKVTERIKEWTEDEKLISLIKSGCFDEKKKKKTGGEYKRFSMRELDVEKLMKVAPRVEMSSAGE